MSGDRAADLVIHGKSASGASRRGVSEKVGNAHHHDLCKSASEGAERSRVTESQVSMAPDYGRVIRRYQLQACARELLPREGVARCMRGVVPRPGGPVQVDVLYAPLKGAAHYGGLQMCRSVWHCPICSAKISERRREELSTALRTWSEEWSATDHRLLLVTFTLQHDSSDDLRVVLTALRRARRLLVSGRGAEYLAGEFGVVGMVRALEVTHGLNGWHPHLHVLMFHDRQVPIIPFELAMKERWRQCIATAGRYASWQHGCDVRFSDRDIAEYIAKWGKEPRWTHAHELAKSVTKSARNGGRTPMQLLADYCDGDQAAGRLWLQYAVNFKGERQLCWSRHLRELLGLGIDKTDEEIAEEKEEIAVILASLSPGAWRVVVANDARGELLEIATSNDAIALQRFLDDLGVGKLRHRSI